MTDINTPTPQLDIGAVLSKTFQVIGRSFPTLALLALIFTVLPQSALNLWMLSQMDSASADPFAGIRYVIFAIPLFLIVSAIYQAATVHTAAVSLGGRSVSFGAALSTGIRNLLPVILISLLVGIAVLFGLLLLVVPGVFLALIWSVTIPAQVVEGKGVIESMNRSRDLTRGSRLMIFLLTIILMVVAFVVSMIGGIVGAILSVVIGGGLEGAITPMSMWPNNVVITPLLSGLTSVVGAVGIAVVYAELRRLKEGAGSESLASVFD